MTTEGCVRLTHRLTDHGKILVLTLEFPPINAGGKAMRTALLDAVTNLDTADAIAVILTGEGGNFVGGADIREFDHPARPPHLPEVISAIENCPIPVVAAIDGAALGGGFEIALGCDARVATERAVVGLPEVTLGLIPGAGGTLRLPRLVGRATGIEMITSGRRVRAGEARDLGLIDAIADGDLMTAAAVYAVTMDGKRLLRDVPVPAEAEAKREAAQAKAMLRAGAATAVPAAIAAIHDSATLPVADALSKEREVSLQLRRGAQSKALRHLFFAERRAGRIPNATTPVEVSNVGIVGGGRMGQGIAIAFAQAGYSVHLVEQDADRMQAALAQIRAVADNLEQKGRIRSATDMVSRIVGCELGDLHDCDLVVEAIIEDMTAKKALLRDLEGVVPETCVLCSNTSYLDLNEMGGDMIHPQRLGGLHFFNPANVMRLVEVIAPQKISPLALSTIVAVSRKLKKIPVLAQVADGFIGNRIFAAYRQQCEFLLEEGASPSQVDSAMRDFGMTMGPFAVFDLAGLDIAWAQRKRLAEFRDPAARYGDVAERLCEQGRFGRKTGRGWYNYENDPKGAADDDVLDLAASSARQSGLTRRAIDADEIQSRLMATIVNTACLILTEKIAQNPADIDLVMVHGYGFPKLVGGPLYWAGQRDRSALRAEIETMCARSGAGIEVSPNLDEVLDQATLM